MRCAMFRCSAFVDWEEPPEQAPSGDRLFTSMPKSNKIAHHPEVSDRENKENCRELVAAELL